MDYVIDICLKEYEKFSDLSLDWLIKSWGAKREDKVIALAYYRKACSVRRTLARQLSDLVNGKEVI